MAKVVHFEIPVDDAERAVAFYRDTLGWEVSDAGMGGGYWLVRAGGEGEVGVNGALIGRGVLHHSPVLVVGVDDLDVVLDRVTRMGGQVLQGKLPVPGVGWSAYIGDLEGNTVGLFQTDAGAPAG